MARPLVLTSSFAPFQKSEVCARADTMAAIWLLYVIGILRYFEDPRMQ